MTKSTPKGQSDRAEIRKLIPKRLRKTDKGQEGKHKHSDSCIKILPEYSCKDDCTNKHTHKTFFQYICGKEETPDPTPPREEFGEMEQIISDCISHAIIEGQNQIYDLKDGRVTGEEVNERMQKSYDYHFKKAKEALRSVRQQAREQAITDAYKVLDRLEKHIGDEDWHVWNECLTKVADEFLEL